MRGAILLVALTLSACIDRPACDVNAHAKALERVARECRDVPKIDDCAAYHAAQEQLEKDLRQCSPGL